MKNVAIDQCLKTNVRELVVVATDVTTVEKM